MAVPRLRAGLNEAPDNELLEAEEIDREQICSIHDACHTYDARIHAERAKPIYMGDRFDFDSAFMVSIRITVTKMNVNRNSILKPRVHSN